MATSKTILRAAGLLLQALRAFALHPHHPAHSGCYVAPAKRLLPLPPARASHRDCWTPCSLHAPSVPACREETVQLLGRHWIIQDASGKVLTEVAKGSRGVVGCTPLLEPGACFEYYRCGRG